MNYTNYAFNELTKAFLYPANVWSETTHILTKTMLKDHPYQSILLAPLEMAVRSTRTFPRPLFGIDTVVCGKKTVAIEEEVVMDKTFCQLRHFKKVGGTAYQPKVLVAAPLSGHFATLLRDTVRTLLPKHDVYITDWKDAKEIPLTEGGFDFDHYVDYLLDFFRFLGVRTHVVAVCQPAVPVLCAVSLLAEYNEPSQPASMTLMGGPIDTRVSPGPVNMFTKSHTLEWFESNVISNVPMLYKGAGRRVSPGFIMLTGFMSLNLKRHKDATFDMYKHLIRGDQEGAEAHRRFYDEYRAVLDMPADYFLDSLRIAFYEHHLPLHKMYWRGHRVKPEAIWQTALMTVEGELDDISCPGQTLAAHDLCANIPVARKHHHFQNSVGHYGIFNGRRWRSEIYPELEKFIATHDKHMH